MKLRGAQIKKIAGAGPAAGQASVAEVADLEARKPVIAKFTDDAGQPWGGIEVELTLPGEKAKPATVGVGGALQGGAAKPGAVKIAFPCIGDPSKLVRRTGG